MVELSPVMARSDSDSDADLEYVQFESNDRAESGDGTDDDSEVSLEYVGADHGSEDESDDGIAELGKEFEKMTLGGDGVWDWQIGVRTTPYQRHSPTQDWDFSVDGTGDKRPRDAIPDSEDKEEEDCPLVKRRFFRYEEDNKEMDLLAEGPSRARKEDAAPQDKMVGRGVGVVIPVRRHSPAPEEPVPRGRPPRKKRRSVIQEMSSQSGSEYEPDSAASRGQGSEDDSEADSEDDSEGEEESDAEAADGMTSDEEAGPDDVESNPFLNVMRQPTNIAAHDPAREEQIAAIQPDGKEFTRRSERILSQLLRLSFEKVQYRDEVVVRVTSEGQWYSCVAPLLHTRLQNMLKTTSTVGYTVFIV